MNRLSSQGVRGTEFYVIASVVVFVAIMAGASTLLGDSEVLAHLNAIGPGAFVGMLALSLVNYVARALRWQAFAFRLGLHVPLRRTMLYYFAGFSMTTTPGKLGEALRLWLMERIHGYSYARMAPLFVGDRLSDLNAMVVLCVLGLGAFSGYGWAVAVLLICGALFTLLFVRPRLLLVAVGQAYVASGRRWSRIFARARHSVRLTSELYDARTLLLSTAISVVGWMAECLAFAWLLAVLGTPIGLQGAMFVFAFSMLVGAVSMLPGGLGGVEATMIALLIVAGTPAELAVVATAVIRVTTLWFAVGLGFIALPAALRLARGAGTSATLIATGSGPQILEKRTHE